MSSLAVPLTRVGIRRPAPRIWVALACLASALAYSAMRIPAAAPIHAAYQATCAQRGMRPEEWLCGISGARATTAFVLGSLLIGIAVALPGAVLAATGRRATALVPLVAGLVVPTPAAWIGLHKDVPTRIFGLTEVWASPLMGSSASFWRLHTAWAVAADAILLAVPAVAIVRWRLPRSVDRARPSERGVKLASLVVVGGIAVVQLVSNRFPSADVGFGRPETWGPPLVMVTFAILLGPDRRWWPWVLAPVAVLLSLGPAMLVIGTLGEFTVLTWFRPALTLAVLGMVASSWRPLALLFSGLPKDRGDSPPAPTRRVRPLVVANAAAAGLLIVAFLAPRYDPLPVQVSEILPTYLGARVLAQDVRAKTNLRDAIVAMDAYRAETGTYVGFGTATGEDLVPAIVWSDEASTETLVVGVTVVSDERARVLTTSASGSAFCIQSAGGIVTIGAGNSIAGAGRHCADALWSPQELAMVDLGAICDEAPAFSVLLCRSVEQLIDEILATPTSP